MVVSVPKREISELNAIDAFDTIFDPIMILDPDGIIRHANRAFSEKLKRFSKDTIGHHFLDIGFLVDMTEAAKKKAKQRFNLALRKKSLPSAEYGIERKDGESRYYLTNISIIEDSNGEMEYAIVFMKEITETKTAIWALGERMKEISCLYAISEITGQHDISSVELLNQTVEVLPTAWQYPDITCARVRFEEYETTTSNFRETLWKLAAEITVFGELSGFVEVYYLDEKPAFDEGPFLREERELIDAIASKLARRIERIRTENALQISQERLEAFMDSALDSIMLYDSEMNLVMLNNAAWNLMSPGIGKMEPVGKHILELSPGLEERGRYTQLIDVLRTGEPFIADDYIPSPSFGDIHLNLQAFKVGDGLGIITSNVTERKKVEAALIESEERFRSTFEESPIALEILDSDGIVIRANQACIEMFGLSSPEDLIGFSLFDDPNLHEDYKDSLRRNVIVREDLPFDFNRVKESNLYPTRKSGKLFLRTIFAPLGVKPDGSKNGYLVQMVDITDQMIAEQSIREANEKLNLLNEELETRVEIRTKELRDAQEELVKKERLSTLGQISGGVGHELRNPLGAIKNATYFLKIMMETPTSEIEETLEILDKEVENCEKIINSLLDYARPTEPVLQKLDIPELIQGVLKRIEMPENINVQSKFFKTASIILGDPHQLERVFLNLITNSIQAMSDGGTLTLRTEIEDGNVKVFVQDTGIGIPEDNMKKLFEPLFTTKAKGIGLGLSIVKTLVESHKGEISVESEVGKGTTFMIYLPGPTRRA
jgi:PAS domain S-box-containing protein